MGLPFPGVCTVLNFWNYWGGVTLKFSKYDVCFKEYKCLKFNLLNFHSKFFKVLNIRCMICQWIKLKVQYSKINFENHMTIHELWLKQAFISCKMWLNNQTFLELKNAPSFLCGKSKFTNLDGHIEYLRLWYFETYN